MNRVAATLRGDDGVRRCWWCGVDPLYVAYHDQEWGVPVDDDFRLFEKMCLEGFQSGLSWLTILRKRENFRCAFADFDFARIARFTARDVERLLTDSGIVRHRGKIESTINNARRALAVVEQSESLAALFWKFEPMHAPVMRRRDQVVGQTDASQALSRELKRTGWTFVGPTTCYALMQAMGMVNDHLRNCDAWAKVDRLRAAFRRPGD